MSHVVRPVLSPYQDTGAAFLAARKRAVLGDEMGLGKTPQGIEACDLVGAQRVLVVCPAVVTENWRREFLRWQRLRRHVEVIGPTTRDYGFGVYIGSYDRVRNRGTAVLNALLARSWDVLIADEAHYVKNRSAARTEAVRCLADAAQHAWGLTGTPMPGYADDLWSLLRIFGPAALGDPPLAYYSWRSRYCVDVPLGNTGRSKIVGIRNVDELRERMKPVLLRRKKTEVLKDLPPLREGEITLSPTEHPPELTALEADPEVLALVRAVKAATLLEGNVEKAVGEILQRAASDSISRLRRVTAAVKARALGPLLANEMAGSEEKLVVMGWHRETLDVLAEALIDFCPVRVDGSIAAADRQDAVDAFQNDSKVRVFIGQIQAAGTGITLTAASNLVFAEMAWTPGDNAQAAMRVHRVGQTRPVLIRYATLAGTIDEAVIRVLRRKTQDIRTVLEGATA